MRITTGFVEDTKDKFVSFKPKPLVDIPRDLLKIQAIIGIIRNDALVVAIFFRIGLGRGKVPYIARSKEMFRSAT
jgi:hypothetical protein